ncbi:MAG TPA: hypothetical protein VJ998_05145 [Pseudomonadales bacterium]|nr:hypothetical protein [Pseudomonadales bacterium]
MILSRALEHLKQQHWTGVFIELVIVVLGVFIGLQVDNWNQARHERALEREYLQRIYADTQATIDQHGNDSDAVQWNKDRLRTQALIINELRSGVPPKKDRQEFDSGLLLFGYVGGVSARWSTVEELQSTGSMAVIRDSSLRDLIGRTDAEIKRKSGIDATFTRSINAYRQQLGSRFAVARFSGDFHDPRAIKLQYDFHALASDPAFINTLTQIDALSRMKLVNADAEMEYVRGLRDELARRLHVDGSIAP